MPQRDSLLARALEPLVDSLWVLFVLVSLGMGAVWTMGIGESSIERWISNPDLRAALLWVLGWADAGWMALAAVNVYATLVARVGLADARRSALIVLGSVIAMAWISVAIGFPLGPIHYGNHLGPKLGPVPVGLPLFWFAVVVAAREALLCSFPRLGQRALAAGVGGLAVLTDLNLEPLAARLRAFWFWQTSPSAPRVFDPPLTGALAWGVLAGLLTLALREHDVVASARKPSWQMAVILAIFHGVFIATHVAHRLSY